MNKSFHEQINRKQTNKGTDSQGAARHGSLMRLCQERKI